MKKPWPIFYALLAAVLYALSAPIAKLFLNNLSPTFIASLLYLGAGFGMLIIKLFSKRTSAIPLIRFGKKDIIPLIGMIILDVLAPILLLIGLKTTSAEDASLLNNFEIVATSLFAFFVFKEAIKKRVWFALIIITIASVVLSLESISSFSFSLGAIFILLAATCWGLENNFTRMLSAKDTALVVIIKGLASGGIALIITFFLGEVTLDIGMIVLTLLLGFVAYGLSIYFYVRAQKDLGAAKTSAYYAITPFIGVILSFIIFQELPKSQFYLGLALMIVGIYLTSMILPKDEKITLTPITKVE